MDIPWTVHGHGVSIVHELPMDSSRTFHGLSISELLMDSPWDVHGQSMATLWPVHGKSMDSP